MSGIMRPLPFETLLRWILREHKENRSIFGIPSHQFFSPQPDDPFVVNDLYGSFLATPIGPAAGPHTQMTQNIVAAWLTGARFIELKTVQIMDELEIPRPCIDMEDEGYNVEWSQELKLGQSIDEYVKAWVLIHILHDLLGHSDLPTGTIFNMSVGYNLEGIQSPAISNFMSKMVDASEEITILQTLIKKDFPQFSHISIPSALTNNVTLSTMHGCPPDEIEKIAGYLMREKHLHTTVKLNPTLLGRETVLNILNHSLGFAEIDIPETVFEHDLTYPRAVELVHTLKATAAEENLTFGVKLSNTLPVRNHKSVMPGDEMYMSGRPLYPITMNLFHKLTQEFKGDLKVSYSAGADAVNTATILSCGACPVTVASDLLKPGGYARLGQYLENIRAEMKFSSASNLAEFAGDKEISLEKAAHEALTQPRYKKDYFPAELPKVKSGLGLFDCITSPCVEKCPVEQDVPEYIWLISQGRMDEALEVILDRNPLPNVTGHVCTHICQDVCTRNNYEETMAIRNLKRIAAEAGSSRAAAVKPVGKKVAIIGSGPSGLSAAAFLASRGVQTTIFEGKDQPGGMMRLIPPFRLPTEIIMKDIDRILKLGVELKTSCPITDSPEKLLDAGYSAVYIAAGFQKDLPLGLSGEENQGVFYALKLLESIRRGERPDLGRKALVIGGGDTAMDAARTASRLTGRPATILYRRTRAEMPASPEELHDALAEGVILEELITPLKVESKNGRFTGLVCQRNRLGEPDASGRRRPVPIPGSDFLVQGDSIIIAIGQEPDLSFLEQLPIDIQKNGSIRVIPETMQTSAPHIFAGGDVVDGPESIISACADGLRFAEAIWADLGLPPYKMSYSRADKSATIPVIKNTRARKEAQIHPQVTPLNSRSGFDLIESTYDLEAYQVEASRCLQCTALCDKCVEVCPNRANLSIVTPPLELRAWDLDCDEYGIRLVSERPYLLKQDRQILHLADFCNECGNCDTFCVHQGKPYMEKPRLFLLEEDFHAEKDNAFFVTSSSDGWIIRRREHGLETSLTLQPISELLTYENETLKASINLSDFSIAEVSRKGFFSGRQILSDPAEMYAVLTGIMNSASYLPFPHQ
ncbi:MAG: putative selenate reductase subunit YgfK [Anaerolineaceae bacterium]